MFKNITWIPSPRFLEQEVEAVAGGGNFVISQGPLADFALNFVSESIETSGST